MEQYMSDEQVDNQEINQEVMGNAGEPNDVNHESGESEHDDLPKGVKDRLGRQERKHQREMRKMQAQLEQVQSQLYAPQSQNSYSSEETQNLDDHTRVMDYVRKKEAEERQAREVQEAQKLQHAQRQHGELVDHLNEMSDKYHDFHDLVMTDKNTFTNAMRDAALLLPKEGAGSAGEVLYKLGKNPEQLERVLRLHPVDQAREMIKLSHALHRGDDIKNSSFESKSLGQVKHNPSVNTSRSVNKDTPISEIRNRMKSNTWK